MKLFCYYCYIFSYKISKNIFLSNKRNNISLKFHTRLSVNCCHNNKLTKKFAQKFPLKYIPAFHIKIAIKEKKSFHVRPKDDQKYYKNCPKDISNQQDIQIKMFLYISFNLVHFTRYLYGNLLLKKYNIFLQIFKKIYLLICLQKL